MPFAGSEAEALLANQNATREAITVPRWVRVLVGTEPVAALLAYILQLFRPGKDGQRFAAIIQRSGLLGDIEVAADYDGALVSFPLKEWARRASINEHTVISALRSMVADGWLEFLGQHKTIGWWAVAPNIKRLAAAYARIENDDAMADAAAREKWRFAPPKRPEEIELLVLGREQHVARAKEECRQYFAYKGAKPGRYDQTRTPAADWFFRRAFGAEPRADGRRAQVCRVSYMVLQAACPFRPPHAADWAAGRLLGQLFYLWSHPGNRRINLDSGLEGLRISERELAWQLSMSQPVVHEKLHELEGSGLVELFDTPYRGAWSTGIVFNPEKLGERLKAGLKAAEERVKWREKMRRRQERVVGRYKADHPEPIPLTAQRRLDQFGRESKGRDAAEMAEALAVWELTKTPEGRAELARREALRQGTTAVAGNPPEAAAVTEADQPDPLALAFGDSQLELGNGEEDDPDLIFPDDRVNASFVR